jgi:hypothetical protein
MTVGRAPGTGSTEQREFLVGMVNACFDPNGFLQEEYEMDLEGWLGAAKESGIDPRSIYEEAVKGLRNPDNAPPYEKVKPE